MKPTGALISGHVLDVNQKLFNQALRFHDPLLYTRWNPRKLKGWGCWEIRRKPEFTTIVDYAEFDGNIIYRIELWENDLVHHVLDAAFLNYDQLRKIKDMDTFAYGNAEKWQAEIERRGRHAKSLAAEKALKLRNEATRTFKTEIKAFKEFVRDGGNPHLLGQHWDSVQELE